MPTYAQVRPIFQPAMRIITAITKAEAASVTTSFAHLYTTGMIVRLLIPLGFGMLQANQLYGPIIVTGSTTFTIDINTTTFDTFSVPVGTAQQAQVTAIGELNSTLTAAVQNTLPGGTL